MNFAVAVLVNEPEIPVNVMVYVPGVAFLGNRIPDSANAVPSTFTVCGRSAHSDPAGPPEQLNFTFSLKPFTELSSRMNPPSTPRSTVSVGGITEIVKLLVGAGPVEITRFTDEPTVTDVPASGASLITAPDATVLLDAIDTVPTTRPAPVIEVVAALCVSPTTFGTETYAGVVIVSGIAEDALTS